MGFSTLLQSVSGFFSRAFWFSRFLPVVVIALVHETLGRLLFGWNFTGGFASILDDDMGKALPTFAGLVVLAYALGPTIPLIRSLLDGSVMPEWLHNWLREDRRAAWDKARRRPGRRVPLCRSQSCVVGRRAASVSSRGHRPSASAP